MLRGTAPFVRFHPNFDIMYRFIAIGLLAALWSPASMAQDTDAPRLTLEAIHASGLFASASFEGGKWAGEGPVVTFVEQDGDRAHLVRYDLETEQRERLVDGGTLYAPDVERTIGIDGYAWSPDGSSMLIYTDSERVWRYNTKGYYYLYDLETQRLAPIARREDGFQMFAKFSPDGRRVAFVRNRDLFVVDLADGSERRLTDDGAPGAIINGTSDWVYEEEFGLRDGWGLVPRRRLDRLRATRRVGYAGVRHGGFARTIPGTRTVQVSQSGRGQQ